MIFYADEWRKLVIGFLYGRLGGELNLNEIDILTLLRIMNIRFLAPPADPEILRFLIKCYFLLVSLF